MKIRRDSQIPRIMTRQSDGEEWEVDDHALGHCLTERMVDFLEVSCAGLTPEERLEQFQDLDILAWRAFTMRRDRISPPEISKRLGISERSVYSKIARVKEYIGQDAGRYDNTDEGRLTALEATDPLAHTVACFTAFGWQQSTIANMTGVSVKTVQRALERARASLDGVDRETLQRHSGRKSIAGIVA